MMNTAVLSGRRLAVVVLCTVTLLSLSLWFSASAVIPQLTRHWGLTSVKQAWMTMSVQIGFVVGALVSAFLNLADRFRTSRVIAAGAVLGALFNALIPVVDQSDAALVLRMFTGASLAFVYPPGMKVMASWYRSDRGRFIGLLVGAVTVGSGMPHLLQAIAAESTALPPWRQVMFGTSALAVLAAGLAWFTLRSGPFLQPTPKPDRGQVFKGLTDRAPRLANFGYFGHMWELYAMWAWVPVVLGAAYAQAGWGGANASLASFMMFVSGGMACYLAGHWADRIGRTAVTTTSLVISGSCCLIVGLVYENPGWLTLLCLVWGFAVVADSAQFSTAVSELADQRYVGTALQVQTAIGFLLTLVTLQLIPVLIDAAGYRWAFLVLVPGPVFGAVSMLRLRRLPEARSMASGSR